MLKNVRTLLLLCATSVFALSACTTVTPDAPGNTSGVQSPAGQTQKNNVRRAAPKESEEAIDKMVRSKPKKRPADNAKYLARIESVSRALRNICQSPKNRAYFDKTPCLPAGMRAAYLQDSTYPTDAQRQVARKVFNELDTLNGKTREIMLQSCVKRHIESARYSEKYVQPRIHRLQERFLAGELTWAQYNQERLSIFNDTADRED